MIYSGSIDYDPNLNVAVGVFCRNIQNIFNDITKRRTRKSTIYIYGAGTQGRLIRMLARSFGNIYVVGFIDKDYRVLESAWMDAGYIAPIPVSPIGEIGVEVDAIICAVAPSHHADVERILDKKFPKSIIYFINKDAQYQSLIPRRPPVVISTIGRCGSRWIYSLLQFLLPGYFHDAKCVKNPTLFDSVLTRKPKANSFVVAHFLYSDHIALTIKELEIKPVFVFRDPRDADASMSYSLYGEFVFSPERIKAVIERIKPWLLPAYIVRFEDLKKDTFNVVKNLLEYLEVDFNEEALNPTIDLFSFGNIAQGRVEGEEAAHHYRKGITGDFKNHYSKRQAQIVKEQFGDDLKMLGYEGG